MPGDPDESRQNQLMGPLAAKLAGLNSKRAALAVTDLLALIGLRYEFDRLSVLYILCLSSPREMKGSVTHHHNLLCFL